MAYHSGAPDELPTAPWPQASEIDCQECRASVGDYVTRALAGLRPASQAVPVHLESCPICSWAYVDLLDLTAATHVKQLLDSWIEPNEIPPEPVLEGLLGLYRMQLGAAERVDDLKLAAWGLSIMGIVHRLLDDGEEAALVHELALRTAKESHNLLSMTISYGDLGYVALGRQQIEGALGYLQSACQYAKQLTDTENEARIHVLLGEVWAHRGNWMRAYAEYREAEKAAAATNDASGIGVAQRKVDQAKAQLLRPDPVPAKTRYEQWLSSAGLAAAPAGESALVLNTLQEVPVAWIQEPTVDQHGLVACAVRFDPRVLPIGETHVFVLDLLFIPTGEPLLATYVGSEERMVLDSAKGLVLQAELPGVDERLLRQLRVQLEERNVTQFRLSKKLFALRIWWKETEQRR